MPDYIKSGQRFARKEKYFALRCKFFNAPQNILRLIPSMLNPVLIIVVLAASWIWQAKSICRLALQTQSLCVYIMHKFCERFTLGVYIIIKQDLLPQIKRPSQLYCPCRKTQTRIPIWANIANLLSWCTQFMKCQFPALVLCMCTKCIKTGLPIGPVEPNWMSGKIGVSIKEVSYSND